jgi:hypothetical protein
MSLNLRKHPTRSGCYLTGDGYLADLGWNPGEQLQRKMQYQEVIVTEGGEYRPFDRLNTMPMDPVIDRPARIIDLRPACDWCGGTDGIRENGVCIECLYRTCVSCGKTYIATFKGSRTCSSECSEILHSERGRWLILERDDFTCIYCGFSAPNDGARLHVDHIVPVKDGGRSYAGNLITSCLSCNGEKNARRLSGKNEVEILAIAAERNTRRGIEQNRVMRLRESDR